MVAECPINLKSNGNVALRPGRPGSRKVKALDVVTGFEGSLKFVTVKIEDRKLVHGNTNKQFSMV